MIQLKLLFILSYLQDWIIAIVYGIANYNITKLQRVQNAAARLIFKKSKYNHITQDLINLHWLPVKYRIDYKLLLVTFNALHGMAPEYICDLIKPYVPVRQGLRSHGHALLEIPRSKLVTCGDRAFRGAVPLLWNSLPNVLRYIDCITLFKSTLKTHLINKA